MDFYKQRRFICEITGHSGLNFFEALRSEMEESREVNNTFPEALKEPILRRIQFSTVSRVDNLVDEVFEEFKHDFYPGEPVLILLEDSTRLHGTIRDKANFAEQLYADGTIKTPAFARYLVKVSDRQNEEALLDQDHITRDRKAFTKLMLRGFIKNNVTRESWTGAPWLVKPSAAEEYKISVDIPKHLQYGARVAEKKAMKKADQDGFFGFFASQQLPELKPAVKGQKSKVSAQELAKSREAQYQEYQRSLNGNPSFLPPSNPLRPTKPPQVGDKKMPPPAAVKNESRPPSPPPIKYPIEDLELAPRPDKSPRPTLKFLMLGETDDDGAEDLLPDDVEPESVGLLLETWNTLNVYCEVFQLDSFTFDDYLQAMRFSSEEIDCELLVELHCAILKKLVNAEEDDGAIQISLPDFPSEDSDESDEDDEGDDEEDEEEEDEEDEVPPAKATRMTTRSSLAKKEAEEIKAHIDEEEPAEVRIHRAAEMFEKYGWVDRLRKRDFRNGGWELVMIGLLHQLSLRPRSEQTCNEILQHLAPLDEPPTQQTAQEQYRTLDINLRSKALQMITMLSLETKAIRNYLEECSNQMTEFRKEKIEHQKARKAALSELRQLHQDRKALQPEPEKSPSPIPELEGEGLDDSKLTGIEGDSEIPMDTDDDDTPRPRALRGGVDRVLERKRKQDEERERKEQLAKQPKGTKQYQRVLKKIDEQKAKITKIEDKIEVVDNDLREADCPRTRCLGLDRFCNRYWWFERNAMPYEGMPNSSTAEARYANGRLWVQGPDELERSGFIDLTDEQRKQYQKHFQTTPAERKKHEEGSTHVSHAREWGYYDDPDTIEQLIAWLDGRGNRESKLLKELHLQQRNIVKYMKNREAYLSERAERAESEEMPTKRVTTRTKTYVDVNEHRLRCLRWRNTAALSDIGHLHVDPDRPAKRYKRAVDDTREAKATRGKPLSRRGSRRG
ncbi:DDT domain superfamily [Penicillium angulare]|uniref:DDT domain superfamily n=1 Tax=Penicillium angulare TaxID=116970 RepID=UPI00253FB5D8|nr:DDT domain superfamily [Penicillium angulare]KAJ5256994.1 DDT domain superfamily [Penicillium angulare]